MGGAGRQWLSQVRRGDYAEEGVLLFDSHHSVRPNENAWLFFQTIKYRCCTVLCLKKSDQTRIQNSHTEGGENRTIAY